LDAQDRLSFARKLRDQGLVDLLIAQEIFLVTEVLKLPVAQNQPQINRYHLTIAKSQQSLEKVVKGYLLWHQESVSPFGGHAVITGIFDKQIGGNTSRLEKLRRALRTAKKIHGDIRWLESAAPRAPSGRRGWADLNAADLVENAEYPFSHPSAGIVCPAEHFTYRDARRAIQTARQTLQIIASLSADASKVAARETFEGAMQDFLRIDFTTEKQL
jgi:HEPN domain-containing protein